MPQINPHINFNGNAEEAFNFYKSVFGGEPTNLVRYKDYDMSDYKFPENEANKLMNIELAIGDNKLIGNDVPSFMGKVNENENRSKIAISLENKQEADSIYNKLIENGQIEVPLSENTTGMNFAMLRDKYGIEWSLTYFIK